MFPTQAHSEDDEKPKEEKELRQGAVLVESALLAWFGAASRGIGALYEAVH